MPNFKLIYHDGSKIINAKDRKDAEAIAEAILTKKQLPYTLEEIE